MKSKSVAQLKKLADKYFSQMIRYRDGERRTDGWWSECITCSEWKPLKQMQAGHFVSRRVNSLRFDETNVNSQCLTDLSNINMADGTKKNIADIKVGDEIQAFDDTKYDLEKAVVLSVNQYIPQKLLRFEADGYIFECNEEHLMLVDILGETNWHTAVDVFNMLQDDTSCNIIIL